MSCTDASTSSQSLSRGLQLRTKLVQGSKQAKIRYLTPEKGRFLTFDSSPTDDSILSLPLGNDMSVNQDLGIYSQAVNSKRIKA